MPTVCEQPLEDDKGLLDVVRYYPKGHFLATPRAAGAGRLDSPAFLGGPSRVPCLPLFPPLFMSFLWPPFSCWGRAECGGSEGDCDPHRPAGLRLRAPTRVCMCVCTCVPVCVQGAGHVDSGPESGAGARRPRKSWGQGWGRGGGRWGVRAYFYYPSASGTRGSGVLSLTLAVSLCPDVPAWLRNNGALSLPSAMARLPSRRERQERGNMALQALRGRSGTAKADNSGTLCSKNVRGPGWPRGPWALCGRGAVPVGVVCRASPFCRGRLCPAGP